jgi:hypothetical protein
MMNLLLFSLNASSAHPLPSDGTSIDHLVYVLVTAVAAAIVRAIEKRRIMKNLNKDK